MIAGGVPVGPRVAEPRLDEILELAREWAQPYATGCVYDISAAPAGAHNHPLDCPRSNSEPGTMCMQCANEALALGILALVGEIPSRNTSA